MSDSIIADDDHGRLLRVSWVDSGEAHLGWQTVDEILATNMSVQSVVTVGYYVGENDTVIAIGQSRAEDGDICNTQVILKSCITVKEWLS